MVQELMAQPAATASLVTSCTAADGRCPKMSAFARSERQALTRRCKVRSCALPVYRSGNIAAKRSITSLADTPGSASSHRCTVGQLCSNGSSRVRHQGGVPAFLRCVGRTSPSFQALDRPVKNVASSECRWIAYSALSSEGGQLVLCGADVMRATRMGSS